MHKQPVTASWKGSKKGRLALVKEPMFTTVHGSEWATVPENYYFDGEENYLKEVFRDGKVLVEHTLDQIRERAK